MLVGWVCMIVYLVEEVIGGTVMQQVWIDFLAVLLSAKFMEISRMLYDRMGT